jgi:hypothetical protein
VAHRLLTTSLVLLLAAGCRPGTTVFLLDREIEASAGLTGIRHTGQGDMVTARLDVHGASRELVSADLDCFVLYIGTRRSESVWVDKLIDYTKGDWPARDGTVTVNVYWAMPDDLKLTDPDLRNAKLAIENPTLSPSCFEFRHAT